MGRFDSPGSVDLQGGVQYNTINYKIVEEFGWVRAANERVEGGTSIIKSVVPRSSVGPGRVRVKVLRNPKVSCLRFTRRVSWVQVLSET